ncbi:MAG: Spy/CpxP family protein refolding chaperone [Acidobacteria bacterium]|nr:Spy/CpxP family protein refolding chaperone [Acidobacteriota bacterium]
MKMKSVGAVSLLTLSLSVAFVAATEQKPPAGSAAAHHACVQEEQQALERGEGFGLAMVADRNGYPGPKHILELRQELALTAAQEAEVQRLYERTQAEAIEVGQKLLKKEAEIERLFTAGNVDPIRLQRLVEDSAHLRADLRWVHLAAHLEAHGLLTAEQHARYQKLRHG